MEEYTYDIRSLICYCIVLCDEFGRPYIERCRICMELKPPVLTNQASIMERYNEYFKKAKELVGDEQYESIGVATITAILEMISDLAQKVEELEDKLTKPHD